MGHLLTASLKPILCALHAEPSAAESYPLMHYYRSEAHPCQVNRKKSLFGIAEATQAWCWYVC